MNQTNNKKLESIQENIIEFYNTDDNYFDKISNRTQFEYRMVIDVLEKCKHKNARILDIGCGPGNLIYFLQKRGYKHIEGIDICDRFLKSAAKKGLNVKKSDILDFNPKKKYDFIITTDVLEHSIHPEQAIKKISSLLTNKGILIIQGPNLLQFISEETIICIRKIHLILKKVFEFYIKKKISPFYRKPIINSETYKVTDADACYLINPFDMIYLIKKHRLNILFLSSFYNPLKKYSKLKKMIICLLNMMPIIRYLGGMMMIVAENKKESSMAKKKDCRIKEIYYKNY